MMGVISLLSHLPGDQLVSSSLPGLDKLAHVLLFTLLAMAFLFGLPRTFVVNRPVAAGLATLIVGVGFGVVDEYHQSFVPGRSPELADLVADAAGVIVAVLIWRGWRSRPATTP
jgi:VanZ family protein